MAQRSLSVSVSMPMEMDQKIAEEAEKHGVKYSEYVRQALRESVATPFDPTREDVYIGVDENGEVNEGAA